MDIQALLDSEKILLLPGWTESFGACCEAFVAQQIGLPAYVIADEHKGPHGPIYYFESVNIELDHPPYSLEPSDTVAKTILDSAKIAVAGPRLQAYGHCYDDHKRWSGMANAFLSDRFKEGQELKPSDMSVLMVLGKISRHCNRPKRDHCVDMAGYAHTLWETAKMEKRLEEESATSSPPYPDSND